MTRLRLVPHRELSKVAEKREIGTRHLFRLVSLEPKRLRTSGTLGAWCREARSSGNCLVERCGRIPVQALPGDEMVSEKSLTFTPNLIWFKLSLTRGGMLRRVLLDEGHSLRLLADPE